MNMRRINKCFLFSILAVAAAAENPSATLEMLCAAEEFPRRHPQRERESILALHPQERCLSTDPATSHVPRCPVHSTSDSPRPPEALAPSSAASRQRLIAYQVSPNPGWALEPASPLRDWMDAAPGKNPYRCLPLVMANQAGWVMRLPCNMTAIWNGKDAPDGLKVTMTDPPAPPEVLATSHFGLGIITFRFPWIFRTSPGTGLWVHGPANAPKENATPLQGLVETDWSHLPFTMNWKLTKRNTPVYFLKGEPICQITPFPFALLESIDPMIVPASSDPQLLESILDAGRQRTTTIQRQLSDENKDFKIWEKTYFKGEQASGERSETHRTNFRLERFEHRDRVE